MKLDTPVAALNRVGKTAEKHLRRLGIATVRDLLFHFPFRYEDYSRRAPISALKGGETVTIAGTIELIASKRTARKRAIVTEALVADATGRLRVVWFGQPFITRVLAAGDKVFLSGRVERNAFGISMVGPEYERQMAGKETVHTGRIVPVYPSTAGVTQKQLRYLLSQVIDLARQLPDWLTDAILGSANFLGIAEAVRRVHFPANQAEAAAGMRRLKFDEIFRFQLRSELARRAMAVARANPLPFQEEAVRAFVSSLPFALTRDQKIAAWEIIRAMGEERPMQRILQGDVGSGKTVVAALALLHSAVNGCQGAMMAPTDVLARQHFASLSHLFAGSGYKVGLFTGTSKKAADLENLLAGRIHVAVGTHALVSGDVLFHRLGLAVIDEQQRFGVAHRKLLRDKAGDMTPHVLSMTATPIPRSLALAIYGDLALSTLRMKPPGRSPVITKSVAPQSRELAYQFIRGEVEKGRQAFVVCPLIGVNHESRITNYGLPDERRSVMVEYEKLSKKIFPDLRVGCLHGKMKPGEKGVVMAAFAEGEFDILVSTSVVEVGVDVTNATIMAIEGAERFGLSQLHQFRGRVGRGEKQSYCLLFSDALAGPAANRLEFFARTDDGFVISEYDLRERGAGEIYGTAQSGLAGWRLASLYDTELIRRAQEIARNLDFSLCPGLVAEVERDEEKAFLELS